MIHPLIQVLATRPDLLADHASGYAALALAELGEAAAALRQRALLGTAAVVLGGLAAGLAGMAMLLAAALPVAQMPLPWLLAALPLALAVAAGVVWRLSRRPTVGLSWATLKAEWAQDVALIDQANRA